MQERFGPEFHTAVIGPAGENCVRFATISHDNRHAGRGGLGAVMGSKRLKAVVVRRIAARRGRRPGRRGRTRRATCRSARSARRRRSTANSARVANLLTFNRLHALPTRNFQQGKFDEADDAIRRVAERGPPRGAAVRAPPAPSAASTSMPPPMASVRLEYESLFALGPLCGIADRDVVLRGRPPVRSARAGHHLGRRDHRLRHGMRRAAWPARSASEGCASATVTCCCHCCRRSRREEGLGDLLAEGIAARRRRSAAMRPTSLRMSRGWNCPATSRAPCKRWPWASPSGQRGADHNRSGAYEVDFSPRADRLHGSPDTARAGGGHGGPRRPDRLADPVQVSARRLRRSVRGEGRDCCGA